MLKSIRKLLSAKPTSTTVVDIDRATSEIDISALEDALAAAEMRRTASLLDDSTIDQILAAERAVDEARIELDRGRAALAELGRRRIEVEEREQRAALERRHAEVQAKVDEAVARIEAEYPKHAAAIADLAALAKEADAAAREWLMVAISDNPPEGLGAIDYVSRQLGWDDEFAAPPSFDEGPSLPPVGDFHGYGEARKWPTHSAVYAISGGAGSPSRMAQEQMDRGPRWPAAA